MFQLSPVIPGVFFFPPQEEDEEIDPDVRELGDYFINDFLGCVLSIEYPGDI